MLKKLFHIKLKLIGFIVFLLILIQLVTAYWFGFIAKEQFNSQFQQLTNSPFIKVVKRDYRQGIFSSDITTVVAINSSYAKELTTILLKTNTNSKLVIDKNAYMIQYTTHVDQGLFAGVLHGIFLPTLAYTKSSIIYSPSMAKLFAKFFNGKEPLNIDNVLYLNKSGRFRMTSPKFNYEEAVSGVKVLWGGLNLVINYDSHFKKFDTLVAVPNFELSAPTKGIIQLQNFQFISHSKKSINDISIGNTNVTLGMAKVEWKDPINLDFRPGDVLHLFTGLSAGEFVNGLDVINPNGFVFNDVSYLANSSEVNQFFQANSIIGFKSLVTNNKIYGPMNFDLSVEHIDAKAFSQLLNKMRSTDISGLSSANSSGNNNDDNQIKTLKKYLSPILANEPIIRLNQFYLLTPSGVIKMYGFATTKDFINSDLDNEQKFLQKINFDFEFSVPQSVLSYIFVLQMRYLLSAGNAQMDVQSQKALTKVVNILLDNQVNSWIKKGYLQKEGDNLVSHLVLQKGKLYSNGKLSK